MPHAHDEMQLQKWQLALSTWIPVHVLMSSCPPVEAHLGSHSEACSPMTRPALQHLARGSLCIPTALGPPDVQPDTCHRSRRLWHLSSYSLIPTPHPWRSCLYHEDMWGPRPPAFQHMKDWGGVDRSHGNRGPLAKVTLQRLWQINRFFFYRKYSTWIFPSLLTIVGICSCCVQRLMA